MRLKPLREQVVVVAGASSGIGRLAARRFAERGARVVVSARDSEGLESLVNEIRQQGGQAEAMVADVTKPDDMQALAERAVAAYGGLDTWAHVAGVSLYSEVRETTPEEFRQVVEVNLLGVVHGALAALPHLRDRGGAFIVVSSVEGVVSLPLQAAYAASKHGVVGFLNALRAELKAERAPVSVTNIMPATMNTPLFQHAKTKLGVEPKGVPPVYPAEDAVEAIVYAAEHPIRDIVVGGAGRALTMSRFLMPGATEWAISRWALRTQRTDRPKTADAPNNLFEAAEEALVEDGEYAPRMRSTYTWVRTRPGLEAALAAGLLVLAAGAVRKAVWA
jgi:NAD(P)-dependent dehydrogenase (short-subunit alcohol dehydrogenase family)